VPIALFAGSFDPIHLGHLRVIEQAASAFDEVVVGVLVNPDKRAGLFQPDERLKMVTEATLHLPTVRAVASGELTVDLARSLGATVLVRAAHKDRGPEFSMAAMNHRMTGVSTVVIPVDAGSRTISSTLVRQLVATGHLDAALDLVPASVGAALRARVHVLSRRASPAASPACRPD
jgi:pantetheine-phosphate adenylyltransferase